MHKNKFEGILIWEREWRLRNKIMINNNLGQGMRIWIYKLEISSRENKIVLGSYRIL